MNDRPGETRLTVILPSRAKKDLRIKCAMAGGGVTMSDVTRKLIERFLRSGEGVDQFGEEDEDLEPKKK
jgi:hypothetical protein